MGRRFAPAAATAKQDSLWRAVPKLCFLSRAFYGDAEALFGGALVRASGEMQFAQQAVQFGFVSTIVVLFGYRQRFVEKVMRLLGMSCRLSRWKRSLNICIPSSTPSPARTARTAASSNANGKPKQTSNPFSSHCMTGPPNCLTACSQVSWNPSSRRV